MSQENLLICRFFVASFSCCIAFLFLGTMLYRSESGFYAEREMPIPVLDGPHIRARGSFYKALVLVVLVQSLLGICAYETLSSALWSTVGEPALVGAYFSMVCAWGFFSDRVRPRFSPTV